MNDRPKKRWGFLPWSLVAVVLLLGGMLAASLMAEARRRSHQSQAVNNCKQIIIAMKQFAASNSSIYPCWTQKDDGFLTANAAFRVLFQEGFAEDERIFGCPGSSHRPDGQIGSLPDFKQALQPGENHWMLLKGQSDTSVGSTPLIIESALNTSWPPRWDVSADAGEKRGRAWKGRQIIIGRNDGSVNLVDLRPDGTRDSSFWNAAGWLPEGSSSAELRYLDIEERKTP